MSARDTIWERLVFGSDLGDCMDMTDNILKALTAAGYRILAPDDLDDMTLERAADEAFRASQWIHNRPDDIATAIRSLKKYPGLAPAALQQEQADE